MNPLRRLLIEMRVLPDTMWDHIRAFKGTPQYQRMLVAAIAHRATLRSRWSVL